MSGQLKAAEDQYFILLPRRVLLPRWLCVLPYVLHWVYGVL